MAGRGGKRPGAGRKPGSKNKLPILRANGRIYQAIKAGEVLATVDELALWQGLLADPRTRLSALCYLSDKRDGKAKQMLEHTGEGGGPVPVVVRFVDGR